MSNDHATANITCTISGTNLDNLAFTMSGDYVDDSTGDIDFSGLDKKVNVNLTLENLVAGQELSFDTSTAGNNFWVCPQASGKPTSTQNSNDNFADLAVSDATHLSFEDKNPKHDDKQYFDYMIRVKDSAGIWHDSDPVIVNR